LSSTSSAPHGRGEGEEDEQAAEHDRGAAPNYRSTAAAGVRRVRVSGSSRGVYHLPGPEFAPGDFEDPADFDATKELAAENEEYEADGLLPRLGETEAEALLRQQRQEDEDGGDARRSRDLDPAPSARWPPRYPGPLTPVQRRVADAFAAIPRTPDERDSEFAAAAWVFGVEVTDACEMVGSIGAQRPLSRLDDPRTTTATLKQDAAVSAWVRKQPADPAERLVREAVERSGLTLAHLPDAFKTHAGRYTDVQVELRPRVRAALAHLYADKRCRAEMMRVLGCSRQGLARLMRAAN